MATSTMGTTAQTTLTALPFNRSPVTAQANTSFADADFASINALILDDYTGLPIDYCYTKNGVLVIPRRGMLKILPGDYIAVDTQTGWPILVSNKAASAAGWVHT